MTVAHPPSVEGATGPPSGAAPAHQLDAEERLRRWLCYFPEYARDNLKIQTIDFQLIPFELNPIQVAFNNILRDITAQGRLIRVVVLKARREGISTYVAGRYFWKTTTNRNRYTFMVTHEPDATDTIFNMHKRFLVNLDPTMKPTQRYNNKKVLEFNNPKGPGGLDSAIRVATAGKEDVGSSQLIHFLHASEIAKWPEHTTEALLTSILQCVPDVPGTEIIEESTAKGLGGKFYERYWSSRFKYRVFLGPDGEIAWKCDVDEKANKSNAYSSVFFPWFVFPTYQIPIEEWERNAGEKFTRTPDEEEIVKLHLDTTSREHADSRLAWRRWCIENKCQGSVELFNQEYPSTDWGAFISTGTTVFDTYTVLDLLKNAPDPIASYTVLPSTGDFLAKRGTDGELWVWKEPVAGRSYVIAADVAEGIEVSGEGGAVKYDFSTCDVIDQLTGEQVAQWHGHIDPDLWGKILFYIGKRYNFAWMAPERNNHGNTTISVLLNMRYPRLYVERIPDPPGKPRKRYGWLTTGGKNGTKFQIIDALVAEMRDGTHGIKSRRTFEEMLSFKRTADGKYEAEVGKHDDTLISLGIAKRIRLTLPLPAMIGAATHDPSGGTAWGMGIGPGGSNSGWY